MSGFGEWLIMRGDAGRICLPDQSVSLVLGSPPYGKQRLYLENGRDLGIAREPAEWIDWMLAVTAEALRVSRGAVVWVAAGYTEDRNYQPLCEGLAYRWWQTGGSMYRPCYWHRVGIPGNGGDDWFRFDVEYCLCFKRPGPLPWADPKAVGCPPKFQGGGVLSHRLTDGSRVRDRNRRITGPGQWKRVKRAIGKPCDDEPCGYSNSDVIVDIANPGNLISTGGNGGGHLGHPLAHESEAPYPVALAEFFVRSLCPPGGIVLDPFAGSCTTIEAALKHGRRAIGGDLRMSQCRLGRQRISRPHKPLPRRPRPGRPTATLPGFGEDEEDDK
jgi:hypothetical protein